MHNRLRDGAAALLALALLQSPDVAVAQSEGIKVHGRWTIDIREPSGALVAHREFDNALLESGGVSIATLLGRVTVPGLWRIHLANRSFSTNPCSTSASEDAACIISELDDSLASRPYFFPTLTISVPTAGIHAGKLVLGGTATATRASEIAIVTTSLGSCGIGAPAQPCSNFNSAASPLGPSFTSTRIRDPLTNLEAPIPVAAGQIIQVTIVISFS